MTNTTNKPSATRWVIFHIPTQQAFAALSNYEFAHSYLKANYTNDEWTIIPELELTTIQGKPSEVPDTFK